MAIFGAKLAYLLGPGQHQVYLGCVEYLRENPQKNVLACTTRSSEGPRSKNKDVK